MKEIGFTDLPVSLSYLRKSIKNDCQKILLVGKEACPTTVAADKILNQQSYKRFGIRDDIS